MHDTLSYSEELRSVVFWGYDLGERVRVVVPTFALVEALHRGLTRREQTCFVAIKMEGLFSRASAAIQAGRADRYLAKAGTHLSVTLTIPDIEAHG